jgi:beta-mannosidase
MEKRILDTNWELERPGDGSTVPAAIPGDNISALFEAGLIPDPYYGRNEAELQWIGREPWIFRCHFMLDGGFLSSGYQFLELNSVDTFARVSLNGKHAGRCSNMFLRCRFNVSSLLQEGENTLEIFIESPEKKAAELSEGLPYPVPHTVHPVQSMHRNLIRKAQCHAGWDWGPCLMVSGIYGEVSLNATPLERIDAVHTDMSLRDGSWYLDVAADISAAAEGSTMLEIRCAGAECRKEVFLSAGQQTLRETLRVEAPDLWWPAGYGEQPLYTLEVSTDNDLVSKEIGFRTLEVISEPDDHGVPMTFRINGRDVFCKGANWIPMDALPGRVSEDRYEELIRSATDANMNMLRVWGGGHYESETFYRICDRRGILVWQDFMFACALYPSEEWFLDTVREEVEYQVRRLKDHPSIVIWCGNNEDVGALTWFEESRRNRDRYIIDYDRLNEGVIGKSVKETDPGRRWWPSSPSAGEGDYSDCWHDDSRGDMHYWSVWHEGKPFEAYREVTPRFCSEFGFQSFPSARTVNSFAPPGERNITSPVMEHHQKNDRGNTIIISTISRYFRFPESFEETLYLSQVQQAMAITTAVEEWRSRRPICMGALYWQLNDNWPVASWSSLEYDGGWKPLHYAARRFFAPLHIVMFNRNPGIISVYGLNDTLDTIPGSLEVTVSGFDGVVRNSVVRSCSLEPDSSTLLSEELFDLETGPPEDTFLHCRFVPDDGGETLENFLLSAVPKSCRMRKADIQMRRLTEGEKEIIELITDVPAFYVVLESREWKGRFSDNCFHLLPRRPKLITLKGEGYPSDLNVRSLRSS